MILAIIAQLDVAANEFKSQESIYERSKNLMKVHCDKDKQYFNRKWGEDEFAYLKRMREIVWLNGNKY